MKFITREEVIKLGKISQMALHEDEIEELTKQVEAVLSYAVRVVEIAGATNCPDIPKPRNIMREDISRPSCSEIILRQAPLSEGNYFVVPAIIKQQE